MNFKEKVVVVTGAAQGLGKDICEKFLSLNADKVVLLDVNIEKLMKTRFEIDKNGDRTIAIQCDVTDVESVEAAFCKVTEIYGSIDILINNAGITSDNLAHKMSYEEFDRVIKVSLYGAFNCIKQVISKMREREYGRIISISSLAAKGNFGQLNYSSAKAGIIGLTKTLAIESASKKITVNAVAPSITKTEIIETIPDKVLNSMLKQIPAHRIAEPEEISSLVAFLASDEASYINGQCIFVTGGW